MIENGLFVLGGPETHLHDILWDVHDEKNHGRSEGEENFREFPATVGGRGRAMHGVCTFLSFIVAIKDKKYGVYSYINRSCLHHVIVLIALLHFSVNLIH